MNDKRARRDDETPKSTEASVEIRHARGALGDGNAHDLHDHTHEGEVDVRRTGRMHYHEEVVRPVKVRRITHKNPAADLVYIKDRAHAAREVELPMRTINIHIGELRPGASTRLHKHHNEAAIYIIKGKGYSEVQGQRYDWETGDFLYMPSMCWHRHVNEGTEPVLYMGITNKRMLDWLAMDRKVEAGIHVRAEEAEEEIKSGRWSPYSWYRIDADAERGVEIGPPGFIRPAEEAGLHRKRERSK